MLVDGTVGSELVTAYPSDGFKATSFEILTAEATSLVGDGDVIDLGDRAFTVLRLPCHSPGSIGLWEAASGTLFAGDAIYDGQLLDELPGSDLNAYVSTMERLRLLPVTVVHGGHGESFGKERMLSIIDAYLAEEAV